VDYAQYINRTNIELQKLGVMGATIVVASGDSGAHGRTDKKCLKVRE
jgi:subtilase family serine protease